MYCCDEQCYYGAENMRGTQAQINKNERCTTYIHCFNSELNIAVVDATENLPKFFIVLQNVYELLRYFNQSTKRTDMLYLKTNNEFELTKYIKLKLLCPTK